MKRIWPQIPYPETVLAQVSGKILQEEPERHYTLFPELPPWLEADCFMAKVSEVPRKDLLGMLSLRDMWEKIIDDDNGSRLTYLTTMLTGHIYIILDLKVTSRVFLPENWFLLYMGILVSCGQIMKKQLSGSWRREAYNTFSPSFVIQDLK